MLATITYAVECAAGYLCLEPLEPHDVGISCVLIVSLGVFDDINTIAICNVPIYTEYSKKVHNVGYHETYISSTYDPHPGMFCAATRNAWVIGYKVLSGRLSARPWRHCIAHLSPTHEKKSLLAHTVAK